MRRNFVPILVASLSLTSCLSGEGSSEFQVSEPAPSTQWIASILSDRPFLELTLDEKIQSFIETPNTIFAANIAATMGQSGDTRWVAWLLDILRLGFSSETTLAATRALQDLSSIAADGNLGSDFVTYGNWFRNNGFHPGAGYVEWKKAFLSTIDAEYYALLQGVKDANLLSKMQWGGVRRGGIPELNFPEHILAHQADFLTDNELVLGAVVGETPIAYPLRFVNHHEFVNDVVGEVPIALGYCSLCKTGILFQTGHNDNRLTFQTSGLLIDSNKIMVDNETNSLWRHLQGEAITGPLKGTVLKTLPLVTTSWADWLAKHPHTLTLSIPEPTWFPDQPERMPIAYDYTPDSAYSSYYASEDLWFPTVTPSAGLDPKEEIVGVNLDGDSLAIPVRYMEEEYPFALEFASRLLLVMPTKTGARLYLAASTSDHPNIDFLDIEFWTEKAAQVRGFPTLHRITANQMYWFAWYGMHPRTEIWEP